MAVLVFLALFLSFTSYSSAQYCLCKPGSQAPDPYKKVIDYACGNGANCGPIQQNGPCYQANNIQGMCSYAANSYYQNKKPLGATCDFGGVAAPSGNLPTDMPSGCTFPTSAGPVSTSTGISSSPPGGTTTTPGGINTVPGGINTAPGGINTAPGGINTVPGSGTSPGDLGPMSLGPAGGFSDPNANDAASLQQISTHIVSLSLTLLVAVSLTLRV